VQSFALSETGWTAISELRIEPLDEWLMRRDPAAWASGPGADAHAVRLPDDLSCVPPELRTPGAASLLSLGLGRYHAGEADDVWALEPLYLRPSAAETQWDERKRG
jgi:hypothetical protein